ncbi:MAG TPA: N-acetylmuramoyl-L-alanine amidase-like domain-containing protein [Vitreimonas sp.]|uniref:N-acetylmuramoyl-L-alanine amidase-like domain-containing protein n=1 Tax=Vitreimonas sp. TaxID=3069702 RepID=UPI002D239A90|nr:N-acetylmuramoyl-L-alanine amidase-like domain-containing protein [Vitreimonas sp.]HYD86024.1 N-acetylmuramoyl-L-alanine amidase-like domain-containing protein [Vitreimonas sp.]
MSVIETAECAEVENLLRSLASERTLGARVEKASAGLLGRPYVSDPLGGGPQSSETLNASVRGFDCVTYCETVYALAFSSSAAGFLQVLRRLRYAAGEVRWISRHHYFADWIDAAAGEGFFTCAPFAPFQRARVRHLSALVSYPVRTKQLGFAPIELVTRRPPILRSGDLVAFGSTREDLDVFHCGLIAIEGSTPILHHCAKSVGESFAEPIADFIARNTMAGLLLARPCEPPLES